MGTKGPNLKVLLSGRKHAALLPISGVAGNFKGVPPQLATCSENRLEFTNPNKINQILNI